jgi:hypothetical protein
VRGQPGEATFDDPPLGVHHEARGGRQGQ